MDQPLGLTLYLMWDYVLSLPGFILQLPGREESFSAPHSSSTITSYLCSGSQGGRGAVLDTQTLEPPVEPGDLAHLCWHIEQECVQGLSGHTPSCFGIASFAHMDVLSSFMIDTGRGRAG